MTTSEVCSHLRVSRELLRSLRERSTALGLDAPWVDKASPGSKRTALVWDRSLLATWFRQVLERPEQRRREKERARPRQARPKPVSEPSLVRQFLKG